MDGRSGLGAKTAVRILHKVFWGTHGCEKRIGHKGGCRCHCKVWLDIDAAVYGEDYATCVRVVTRGDGTKKRH